jgi:hypothetical protein
VSHAAAQASRLCQPDRAVGRLGVVYAEPRQHRLQAPRHRGLGRKLHHRVGQRRAQQHDAKVGIESHKLPSGLDRAQDALTHPQPGRHDDIRRSVRTGDKVVCVHSVAGRRQAHVARLEGRYVGDAGVAQRLRHQGRREAESGTRAHR